MRNPVLGDKDPLEIAAPCWPLSAWHSWQITASTSELVPLLIVISTGPLLRLKIPTPRAEQLHLSEFRKAAGPAPARGCQNKWLYSPTASSPETRFVKEKIKAKKP